MTDLPPDHRPVEIPDRPNPRCKMCYGRGHIGQDAKTGRYRICQKCYFGARDSILCPHELIDALEEMQAEGRLHEVDEIIHESEIIGEGPEVPDG